MHYLRFLLVLIFDTLYAYNNIRKQTIRKFSQISIFKFFTHVHFTGLLVIYYPSTTKLTLFIYVTRV